MTKIKVGIIGYGYWGLNLVRNFVQSPLFDLISVADLQANRLELLKQNHPYIQGVASASHIIENQAIEAVVIATPISDHYSLALKALQNEKHVLVEKPLTTSLKEAKKLREVALKKSLSLMVDHTFLYTGAVEMIHKIVSKGEIGNINYIDSMRINLGLFKQDVNVLWDLAVHDLSIIDLIVDEDPAWIQAIGVSHTDNKIENIAFLILHYKSGLIAHINCSWVSPVKLRTMLIGGDKKMIIYNDIEPTDKVKVYDKGFSIRNDVEKQEKLIDYRLGDLFVPKIKITEALKLMVEDFANSIRSGLPPRSNIESALKIVSILEAAEQSLQNQGSRVKFQFNAAD